MDKTWLDSNMGFLKKIPSKRVQFEAQYTVHWTLTGFFVFILINIKFFSSVSSSASSCEERRQQYRSVQSSVSSQRYRRQSSQMSQQSTDSVLHNIRIGRECHQSSFSISFCVKNFIQIRLKFEWQWEGDPQTLIFKRLDKSQWTILRTEVYII